MSPPLAQTKSVVLGNVKSADEMDEERREQVAYEYLCRLEEAKKWIEGILHQELPEVTIFEQNIRNGVVLAKLAAAFAPKIGRLAFSQRFNRTWTDARAPIY